MQFDDLDVAEAAAWLAARPADAPFAYVVTPNAQHLVQMARGYAYGDACRAATLVLNDSQVVRGLARLFFGQRIKLAAGSDLTMALLRGVVQPDDAITVIGGPPELPGLLAEQYGLRAIVQHCPPMGLGENPEAMAAAVQFVLDHPARFTFSCTGAPRSEAMLLAVSRAGGGRGLGLSVGSSLLFATGLVRRAPLMFRKLGLEWLWRLAINPRMHARRVFVESMPLLGLVWTAFRRQRGASGR
ncbi:WecB/TagA/CpsF family glycosyltransferase [Sediminicoccus sp. KRV36]|uniref:WecB/TagA/CpsF family glycosyltransferase n=1 Tax=Sediminicoccus sp. KRV36 TaxID=3133721 RepID=UPI00200C714A|nr:WecB/TagA/CpsF family glycosyltransferase [Sediminicoccus rosea]UPY35794.1 WecB/TagA/CpsF family glycosyltransferase [Sediminicoccus rosea]